jgi:hypothetical protein
MWLRSSARPGVGKASHRMEQAARTVVRDGAWLERVETGERPSAVVGPVAAGEKVIALVAMRL